MKHVVALVLALAGCQPPARIAECDAMLATVEHVARCPLTPAEHAKLDHATTKIRDLLDRLADAGGAAAAGPELAATLRTSCAAQQRSLQATLGALGSTAIWGAAGPRAPGDDVCSGVK